MDINFNNPDLDLDILKSIIRKYSRKEPDRLSKNYTDGTRGPNRLSKELSVGNSHVQNTVCLITF